MRLLSGTHGRTCRQVKRCGGAVKKRRERRTPRHGGRLAPPLVAQRHVERAAALLHRALHRASNGRALRCHHLCRRALRCHRLCRRALSAARVRGPRSRRRLNHKCVGFRRLRRATQHQLRLPCGERP